MIETAGKLNHHCLVVHGSRGFRGLSDLDTNVGVCTDTEACLNLLV